MFDIGLLSILCVISVELIIRTKVFQHLSIVTKTSKRATSLMTSKKISDHWKEKVLPAYSLNILKASITMLVTFLMIIALFLIASKASASFLSYTLSAIGIVHAIALSAIYVKIRFAFWSS